MILSGDAHMLAADDGSNANYSDDPAAAAIRVLHGAALDRTGSVKGGPYSLGTFPNQAGFGQYALVSVIDMENGELAISYSGRAVDSLGMMTERVSYNFAVAVPEPAGAAFLLFVGAALVRRRRARMT